MPARAYVVAMLKLVAAFMLFAMPAGAVEAHYEAYAAGLSVVAMDAQFDVAVDRYTVKLEARSTGAFNLLARTQTTTTAEGRFVGARPTPTRFFSTGTMRGTARVTQIDYRDGRPVIRQLLPPNETEREPVPPERQADTVDTLSAMAELIRQVNATRRCEGHLTVFDGRRLSTLEAHTSGEQELEPTGRSSFAGRALRCEFKGQQVAGFELDVDRAVLARPQQGTAWFAAVTPGGPLIPVRIAFRTRWFGEATMYLVAKPG